MTSNRLTDLFRCLRLCLLCAALAACEETKTVAPADRVALEVIPSGTVELTAGDTLRLRVTIQNAANPAITFQSSADSVASVSDQGLITARRSGIASILVASVADPTSRVVVVVRVSSAPPQDDSLASVRVAAVLDPSTGASLDPAQVRGRALVRLDFSRGQASRLEVLAADSVVCSQSFNAASLLPAGSASAAAAAVPFDCVLETARFDSISGAVAFPNGPLAVSARLVDAAGGVRATAAPVTLTLANPDTLFARISAPRQALDAQGLQWIDGPLTVTAVPILYGATSSLSRARFTYRAPGGETIALSDDEAPFSVVVPEDAPPADGGLAGVTDPALRVSVSTVRRSGEPGPQGASRAVRFDNQVPRPGGLLGREWVGAETSFQALYDARAQADAGVAGITARFFVGSPAAEPAEIVAGGNEVQVGADLAEAGVGSYRFAVLVCDALANCETLEGFSFGVDRSPPVISGTGLADRAVNPAQDLALSVSDNRSGFGPRFLVASVTLLDTSPATAACGPVVEEIDLPGRQVGAGCVADTVAVLRTPRATPGYYTYRVAPIDQAQNLGEVVTRTILVDRTAPSIASLSVPAQLVPGSAVTVGVVAEDNLDLLSASASLVYPAPDGGRLALPFAPADTAGAPFDSELEPRFTTSLTFPFVGSLTYPVAGRLGGARTFAVDSLRVRVRDVARLAAEQGRALAATAPAGNPFASVDSVDASLGLQNVCTARCLGTDRTSTTFTVRTIGPPGFHNPFADPGRVYFFSRDSTGAVTLLDSTASAPRSETGDRRIFSYSTTVRPEAGLTGDLTLFAVGVNAAGNGLLFGEAQLHLFTRP